MVIKGITVTLYTQAETGRDDFNKPIVTETAEQIENVLVYPASETEILDTINLTGRKAVYNMAIPKGDTHDWTNKHVSFFGKDFRTIGEPTEGIEELIPLSWNKKVRCEIYE